jgi:hypothetical protein
MSTTQKGHTMLIQTMLAYIPNLFKLAYSATYGSSLENYITSKNPQSVYEVEYWTKEYDKQMTNKGI